MQPVSSTLELGGLTLATARIGDFLTVYGLPNGIFQVFYFASSALVWVIAFVHVVPVHRAQFFLRRSIHLHSAAVPNRASLGVINELCQPSVSIMLVIGPALANSLFSLSMQKRYPHR
ncbi:Major facilitator superfamily multidrug-resistance DHA1 sub-family [Mycena venus]|uniref:Major facilitator superfamily multidrug-resistance DHA1 sub-family n=1 Tax=Mycena venus TaxID=2733690 RepID=A0A8H6YL81_9AGAR|nr:Major facilitator superfamily multidrug-resistance DHA1 sub-family [Mycena venus]